MAIRFRPTGAFYAYLLLLALMWLTAANYGNNLAYLITCLLAGVGLVTPVFTYRQLKALCWQANRPPPVFAGQPARLSLRLRNLSAGMCPKVAVELPGAKAQAVALPAAGSVEVELELVWPTRGLYRPGPLRLSSVFPLGLVRVERDVGEPWEVWVYPKPVASFPLFPTSREESRDGELEFAGLRSYQPGDSLRLIYWKGLAKGQGLQVKYFVSAADKIVQVFDWDSLPPAEVETKLSWLCRMVLDAEAAGVDYGLTLPLGSLAPGRGATHLHACLKRLARFPKEER